MTTRTEPIEPVLETRVGELRQNIERALLTLRNYLRTQEDQASAHSTRLRDLERTLHEHKIKNHLHAAAVQVVVTRNYLHQITFS